jgi:CDP-glucose 4,6-dehydratase
MASLAADLSTFVGRRVLITGHTGFKGSWLSYLLARAGADVTGVALPPLTTPSHFGLLKLEQHVRSHYGDIRNLSGLQKLFATSRPEVVFHLAAQAFVRTSYADPYTTFSTNVLGSANVLECVKQSSSVSRLVFVTSDKCYKNKEQQHGYVETDELGNVIGGGDWSPDRLIPDCIRSLQHNVRIDIRSPRATRPWQHVLEPLSGYIRLAVALGDGTAPTGSSWNFGPPETAVHEVEEVATLVAARWGASSAVHITPSQGTMHEARLLQLNSAKANRHLDWSVRWNFHQTMHHTIDWYRAWNAGESAEVLTATDINEYLSE